MPRDGFEKGLKILESRYRVVYDERLFERTGYLAGDDDRRAEELSRYLADPEVRAVIPARGGYGLMRIIDRLDPAPLKREPKLVVGFSDLTVLLSWCVNAAQVRPVHGPMVVQLGALPPEDAAWLFRVLEDPSPPGAVPTPAPLERIGKVGGGALEGRLVGGNLELVTRLLGTPWALDLGASIFMAEEVGERPYRIDRMLTQLKLAGALDAVRGVVLGDFTRCEEPDGSPPSALDVVGERLAAFELPGLCGLPAGHGARNLALPLGGKAVLDLGQGQLVLEEGAVD